MAYNYEYPGVNMNDYNNDWILKKMKELILEWKAVRGEFESLKEEVEALKHWLDNLNLQEEVNNKIDEMVESGQIADLLHNDFLPLTTLKTDYGSDGKACTVYYSIIPPTYSPELFDMPVGDLDYPANIANNAFATIAVNGGLFTSSGARGYVRNGGVTKQGIDTNMTTELKEECEVLGFKNGSLQAVSANSTDKVLDGVGFEWALTGWYSIVRNGVFDIGTHEGTDYHPRTFIGQNMQGSYILGVCEGRRPDQSGMRLRDIYDFCISVGFSPTFLFSLDGGASCAYYDRGVRQNEFTDNEYRKVATMIGFRKSEVLDNNTFQVNKSDAYNTYRALRDDTYIYGGQKVHYYQSNQFQRRLVKMSVDEAGVPNYTTMFNSIFDGDTPFAELDVNVNGTVRNILKLIPGSNQYNTQLSVYNQAVFLIMRILGTITDHGDENNLNGLRGTRFFTASSPANAPAIGSNILVLQFAGKSMITQIAVSPTGIAFRAVGGYDSGGSWHILSNAE